MLDYPKPILSIAYVTWRGLDIADAEHGNILIGAGVSLKQFCIADRVRRSIHKFEQILSAIFGAVRRFWTVVTLVWHYVLRIRLEIKDLGDESQATSGTCSTPDRNITLITLLAIGEDLAQCTNGNVKVRKETGVLNYSVNDYAHWIWPQPSAVRRKSVVHGDHRPG